MPRPNRPRSVLAEVNLAQRVAHERAVRGWSPEGLARRMADAGCPINISAIYRIEQADSPRRITVDELVGFSRVFGVPVEELLLPIGVTAKRELVDRLVEWDLADNALRAATERRNETWESLRAYVSEHPEVSPHLESAIQAWARYYFESSDSVAALTMHRLTGDGRFLDAFKAANRDLYPDGDDGNG